MCFKGPISLKCKPETLINVSTLVMQFSVLTADQGKDKERCTI